MRQTAPSLLPALANAPRRILSRARIENIKHRLKYWSKPLLSLLIYALTIYVAVSAPFPHAFLGLVSAPLGTWFLTLLAKGGDIIFGIAVADTFDTLTWRKLKERKWVSGPREFGGMRLDMFLSLVSSTGAGGLVEILTRKMKGDATRKKGAKWMAVVRLGFLIMFIPGPGIILMANVNQKRLFYDITRMNVSGGLAEYDPAVAATYHTALGPEIAKLVQTMLRDRTVTWPVDTVSQACRKERSCASYLVAGPYQTTAPWPFTVERGNLDAFRLHNAPFYQVDMWNPSPDLEFEERDCTLYGGANRTTEYSMRLCISQEGAEGLLAAGWKSCQLGYSSDNTCLDPASNNNSWTTHLTYHRRLATITFSRLDLSILEVSNLSPPYPAPISPSQLFESLNQVLYRPDAVTNDLRFDIKSQQYVLTQTIGSNLWYSLYERARGLTLGRDWLRNLLALPVYVFQPTMLAESPQLPIVENGTQVQPNLPPENYVTGAYCTIDTRSVPGWGTVIAYTVVAGLLVGFIVLGKAIAAFWLEAEMSEFPMLDFGSRIELVDDQVHPQKVELESRLNERVYRDGRVLDSVADVRIGLKNV